MATQLQDTAATDCPAGFAAANLADPAIQRDPYDYYDWLRDNDPVHWDAAIQAFIVTRDDLVRQVALDWATFSNVGTRDFGARSEKADAAAAVRATTHKTQPLTVVLDPPRHTQYRRIMNQVLSQPRMRDSAPWIGELAADLVAELAAQGGGDIVQAVCIPLPFAVISILLGLPREMHETMREWADSYTEQFKGSISPERELACAHTYVEYHRFFERLVEARRAAADPPDDLVTGIALARLDDGELLSMADALSMIEQFVTAGAETTMNALSMGAYALAQRPDLVERLRRDPAAIETFTEETLRLFAPAQGLFRIAQKDTEIAGVAIPKGAKVMLRWGAANTDARMFECPRDIDLDRANARQHVTFGYGIHKCQGSTLARIELNAVFRCLVEEVDGLRVDQDRGVPKHAQGIVFMGMTTLPLAMAPRVRATPRGAAPA